MPCESNSDHFPASAETGQPFTPEAVDRASHWTGGQPWLVNAIARECVEEILARDLTKPITAALIDLAAENLLRRRDTHLDSLYERLKEERVRRVVEPVILGAGTGLDRLADDCQYVFDLALLRQEKGVLLPANPIYAGQRYPVELKLWEGPKSKEEGMLQLATYCDSCGSAEGWLVFFDRRPKRPWNKKILWQTRHDDAGHTLHFVGC